MLHLSLLIYFEFIWSNPLMCLRYYTNNDHSFTKNSNTQQI